MATAKKETEEIVEAPVQTTGFSLEQVTELIKSTVDSLTRAQNDTPIVVKKEESSIIRAEKSLALKRRKHAEFVKFIIADDADYVTYRIPKVYKRWVGDLTVGLNGAVIKIKANGQPVKIHKSFVPILNKKLRYVDDKVSTMLNSPNDIREMSPMQTY